MPLRLDGLREENAMPSSRICPRYTRSGPSDAADCQHDELAAGPLHSEPRDFIDQTIRIWQERTERKLTREDRREIIENITGFFSILQDAKERRERLNMPNPAVRQIPTDGALRKTGGHPSRKKLLISSAVKIVST